MNVIVVIERVRSDKECGVLTRPSKRLTVMTPRRVGAELAYEALAEGAVFQFAPGSIGAATIRSFSVRDTEAAAVPT